MDSFEQSVVCEAGSDESAGSCDTFVPGWSYARKVALEGRLIAPTLIDDRGTLTPLIDSVLLTPPTHPDDQTSVPAQTRLTQEPKPLLHGLGLNISLEETIDLTIFRR
ncbi:hypothetical protein NliqN6_1348 [Naganishia liquefaciens]|uniref:Uncharacterized protein n=1 Tax=Naganishia liquefaciens TaxID=104408 RepID=A0A8H3TPG5_9TREE|nr:hypothetical protein NliqN6_1348 [Naganishia liquefaciens]